MGHHRTVLIRELLDESANYLRYRIQDGLGQAFVGLVRLAWFVFAVLLAPRVGLWFRKTFAQSGQLQVKDNAKQIGSDQLALSLDNLAHYFYAPSDVPGLVAYAYANFPSDVRMVVSGAEEIAQGIFRTSTGAVLTFSRVDDNYNESHAEHQLAIQWLADFGDLEHLFYLNRFGYAEVLAKAHAYTREESYVRTFAQILDSWVVNNPLDPNMAAWESYSVSERICNWIFALHLFCSSREFRFHVWPLLGQQLVLHADYLATHLETGLSHNHLINNARALFLWGTLFHDSPNGPSYAELGWEILQQEAGRQFDDDGMLREQSSHYQLMLTRTYVEAFQIARSNHRKVSSQFVDELERILSAAAIFLRPDGTVPHIGDISPDIPSLPLVGMVAVGEKIIGKQLCTNFPRSLTEYAMWRLKVDELPDDPVIEPRTNGEPQTTALRASGFANIQSNIPTPLHLTFHCDPVGDIVWHGHDDPLGFELWWNGRTIVYDGGGSSYNNDAWQRYFKSSAAHNTIRLDGLPPTLPSIYRPLWGKEYPIDESGLGICGNSGTTAVIEGCHSGYERLSHPIRLRRKLTAIMPSTSDSVSSYILVNDYFEGIGVHQAEIFFHFGSNTLHTMSAVSVLYANQDQRMAAVKAIDSPEGQRLGYVLLVDSNSIQIISGQEHPDIQGWYSLGYGLKQLGTAMIICRRIVAPTQVDTVFWMHTELPSEVRLVC